MGESIVYFVTICAKDRRKVLATPEVFDAIKTVVCELQKWHVLTGVIMPDHLHWVVSPVVHAADHWPYYLDFVNELPDSGSCQLPVQFKGVGA